MSESKILKPDLNRRDAERKYDAPLQPYRPPRRSIESDRGVRLTERGKRVVATALIGTGVAGFIAGRATAPESGPEQPEATVSYVVKPNDTIWSIASYAHGEGEIRPLVDKLQDQMGGTEIHPGEVMQIPESQVHNPEMLAQNAEQQQE